MTAKENLYRYYHHQTFEVMPLFGEGEHSFYQMCIRDRSAAIPVRNSETLKKIIGRLIK